MIAQHWRCMLSVCLQSRKVLCLQASRMVTPASYALQVLQLEPHRLISNYTGIPLQLMHCPERAKDSFRNKAGGGLELGGGDTTPSGLPRASPSGPQGQPGLKGAVHDPNVDWTSVLDLPAGEPRPGGMLLVHAGKVHAGLAIHPPSCWAGDSNSCVKNLRIW